MHRWIQWRPDDAVDGGIRGSQGAKPNPFSLSTARVEKYPALTYSLRFCLFSGKNPLL